MPAEVRSGVESRTIVDAAHTSSSAPPRSRRSRWTRRLVRVALFTLLVVVLAAWVGTRSWFIVWQLKPILERKLGGEVAIESAKYGGGGRVSFENITLRARGLRGPAAQIALIKLAQIDVDVGGLLSGKVKLEDAQMSGVTVRISEDMTHNGRMNLMALKPKSSGGGKTQPPKRVRISDLTLEVGVHVADTFVLNGSRRLAGEMHPIEGQDDWFAYELAEVDDGGKALGEAGLFIKGQWNALTTEAQSRIEAIALDDRVQSMLPQQARHWWNRMALSGRVDGVMIDWNPLLPLTVSFSVNDIAMTLPVDLGEVWSVYRNGAIEPTTSRPRMNVHGGVIRVSTDSLHLEELRGELVSADPPKDAGANTATSPEGSLHAMVGVPYEISLRVPRLPPIDWKDPNRWMEDALKTSAFELTARMDNFSLAKTPGGDSQAVGLPSIVAKVLAKFQTTGWVLSTEVHVKRGDPAPDDGGLKHAAPLHITGQAYINDATGSYHKFPYRMEDVDAYLQFTDERVNVEYLQARGGGNSTFRVTGYIEPPDKDAMFHLEVTGLNVPLDDRFRAALKGKEIEAVDALFHQASAERMARGGVLPDERMLAEQTRQRDELNAEMSQLKRAADADREAVAALEARIAALDRSIKAGPFVAGGMVDVQLALDRPLGPQKSTAISGFIDVRNAGLIFNRFPYPLRGSGRLKWESDRVTIDTSSDPAGIRFVTASGGVGHVAGSVAFPKSPEGGRKLQPDLTFVIDDDPANDTIFAAIPFGKSELERNPALATEWPGEVLSRSGEIVKGIGLDGAFDYAGRIFTREDTGKMDWDFRVALDGGTAEPNALLAEAINARDLPWPRDLLISALKGDVRIQRSGVSWDEITGASGATQLSASGLVDFRSKENGGGSDFTSIQLVNAPVNRSALNMISQAKAATAEGSWNRFQPEGFIDGEINWRSDAAPGEGGTFTFQPRDVSVLLGAERVAMRLDAFEGEAKRQVRIDGNAVRFDDLAFSLSSDAVPEGGRLTLGGQWTFSGDSPNFEIAGDWKGGRLESGVIPEAMRVFGQSAQATRYEAFKPVGSLDLTFEIARAALDAPPQYRFNIDPQSVEFTLRETRVKMEIDEGGVSITPGSIALEKLSGRAASGAFSVDGHIGTIGPLDASLAINYTGQLRSPEVLAFLPKAVNDSLEALEFQDGVVAGSDGAASKISNGALRLRQTGLNADGTYGGWQTEFTGRIETSGAAFVAGVQFSEVDGSLDLDVSHETGRPMRFAALGRASHATVLGQKLADVDAPMSLNEAGDALEIPAARARSGDGAVSASAVSGIGARRDYRMRVDIVGAPLGNMLKGPAVPANDEEAPAASQPSSAVGVDAPAAAARAGSTMSGEVFASLTLSGERDDPASKRGRGVFRVINGRLSAIPLALQAMNMMQLTLPLAGQLDYADADMYVIGDTAHFEHILFESSVGNAAALQLRGEGTLDLLTMDVAARFRPRSGLAIIRDIIGGIGDMLYEIELTGPLRDPRARIVPLP